MSQSVELTGLAVVTAVLLGLALLVGVLALVVGVAERSRVTVRKWLAAAWLVTLVLPVVLWGLVYAGSVALTYAPPPFQISNTVASIITIVAAPLAVVLTFVVIGWLAGRMVLRPLAAMGNAARRVAAGDLDISLPHPALAEVADVAEAFRAMSAGLQTSVAEQAEAEQQRRLIISAVAHDLRTPLFALRGSLDGLQTGIAASPERRERYLAICREQAEVLERRVADLFTYSRLEYLGERPPVAPMDLEALLRRLTEGLRPLAEERAISLVFYPSACSCMVAADEHLVRRALENVIENALRFTPPGGCVEVATARQGEVWAVSVADSGPGIAVHDLPHIFSPLYRGESSRNRRTGGSGLGLAVARTILRQFGGDLRAENREAGGALFIGTLPVATTAPLPADDPRGAAMAGVAALDAVAD